MFFEQLKTKLTKLSMTETADGYGGVERTWTESTEQFDGYIQRITTSEQQIAGKEGEISTFYIVTDADHILSYHDIVKRLSDGSVFRVLSYGADVVSPSYLSFLGNMSQVTAERWDIDG